jgi:hypothetical protein
MMTLFTTEARRILKGAFDLSFELLSLGATLFFKRFFHRFSRAVRRSLKQEKPQLKNHSPLVIALVFV